MLIFTVGIASTVDNLVIKIGKYVVFLCDFSFLINFGLLFKERGGVLVVCHMCHVIALCLYTNMGRVNDESKRGCVVKTSLN